MSVQKSPKVLFITAHIGAGHGQVAGAVVGSLAAARPDWQVPLVEALDYAPRPFKAYYLGGYLLGMTRLPWAYGLGFIISNRFNSPRYSVGERIRLASERFWLKGLAERIVQERPDLIVSTHFVAAPIIQHLQQTGRVGCPQMVIVTDNGVHRWWYCPDVEHWFVPGEDDRRRLDRWQVPDERITVAGIPVHPKWLAPLDRSKVLADWRLPAEGPIVVLTGGAEFTCGPVVTLARGLLAACGQATVVVLAGRNKELLAALSQEAAATAGRLVPVSFTDRAHELVEVASLMITKPGGVTTTECTAKGRAMILLRPVPGQEAGNARFLAEHGAAVVTRTPAEVVSQAARLLGDPAELARMSSSARALYRPGTQTIVGTITKALD